MDCVLSMRTRAGMLVTLLLLITIIPFGCNSADEQSSTQITKTVGKVESGYAFDWGKSELHAVKQVIVPDSADVRRDAPGTEILVYTQKSLDYRGEVAEPLSIRTQRHRMGVAARMESGALILATYGEWDAGIDGSATIKMVVRVPSEVEVTRRDGLTGRSSPANGDSFMLHSGPPKPSDDVIAKGWMPFTDRYDPQRRVLN